MREQQPERSFQWFRPKGRRTTLYEDVTVDTQPSIHRHLDRDWPVHFEDGRGMWWPESTALESSDWYAFRDPGQLWERPYYQQGTGHEQLIESAVRTARRERLLEDLDPEWIEFLRGHLQVPAFVEHGLWLALASAARDCLSDTVAHCVALEAAMKQRQAQAIVLYGLDLDESLGDFPLERARAAFMEDGPWQPVRRYLERLRSVADWGERVVATNLCLEPTVGLLLRRELMMRSPKFNGDALTPAVGHVAQLEWEWTRDWTADAVRFLIDDERHGARNREVLTGWLADWGTDADRAATALAPVFAELPAGIAFADARCNVQIDRSELLQAAGLGSTAEAKT
jgi:propane 2-monooxygenase small subunit